MVKGLLLGIAIGIGIGWVLFAGTTEPARTHTSVVVEAPAPERKVELEAPVTPEDEPPADPRPVEDRLEIARKTRNWELFRDALAELGALGPEGERKLVAIAGDEALRLQDHVGGLFWRALSKSEVDGIGGAALFRLRDAIERYAWNDARAWSSLVAHHGTARELDALTAILDEDARELHRSIIRSLAGAGDRPEAASRFESLFRENREKLRHELAVALRVLADSNPGLAYRLCRERIGTTDITQIQPIAESLWRAARGPQIEEAKRLLNNIEGDLERVYGLISVFGTGRTRDMVGLEPLLDTPVSIIERAAAGEKSSALDGALNIVRHQPQLYSQRSLSALEAYLPVAGTGRRSGVAKTIELMRDHLGFTSTEWNPER